MRRTVHGNVAEVIEKLLRVIDVRVQLEQARSAIDKVRGKVRAQERFAGQNVHQERNVCLHAANTEFIERSIHLLHGCFKVLLRARELDEERIVVG